jgi:hypothetical protein
VASCGGKPAPQATSQSAAVSTPAPAATTAPTAPGQNWLARARMCGRSLGIAVRCNMVTDQNDFALLRYMALQGLREQGPSTANFTPVEEAFDLAALEMMNSVGGCKGAASGMATLEQKIENTIVAECTKPQP